MLGKRFTSTIRLKRFRSQAHDRGQCWGQSSKMCLVAEDLGMEAGLNTLNKPVGASDGRHWEAKWGWSLRCREWSCSKPYTKLTEWILQDTEDTGHGPSFCSTTDRLEAHHSKPLWDSGSSGQKCSWARAMYAELSYIRYTTNYKKIIIS